MRTSAGDESERREHASDLAFYRGFFEEAPDMFASVCAEAATIEQCNQTLSNRLGWSRRQLLGANIYSIYHPDCHGAVKRAFREFVVEGKAASDALMLLTKDGEGIPVSMRMGSQRDATGHIIGSRMIWRDLTAERELDQLRLELRLQEAQKSESIALLTSSIAHDFNNLLVTIIGNAGLGKRDLRPQSAVFDKLDDIETAAKQAADLTSQLMNYAGHRQREWGTVDLSGIVHEMSHLLDVAIVHKATLHYELADDPVDVYADVTQLRQIVMNLITNSADAVAGEDGRIAIRTGHQNMTREDLADTQLGDCLRPGKYVFVEVTDNGIGLTERQRARMFDPFFTTKHDGHGLGLAAVLGIVRAHDGTLSVSSQLGQGTTFKIMFPEARPPAVESPPISHRSAGQDRHILLVDDEKLVRNVAQRILEKEGFQVTTCRNGEEALATYDQLGGDVDVVLMDVSMPRCNGIDAYYQLRNRSTGQRIVLVSGLSSPSPAGAENDAALRFLQKPFQVRSLIEAVTELLEA